MASSNIEKQLFWTKPFSHLGSITMFFTYVLKCGEQSVIVDVLDFCVASIKSF